MISSSVRQEPGSHVPSSRLEQLLRPLMGLAGMMLFAAGVVSAFIVHDGLTTTALLAAAFALVVTSYAGPYITRIKFREFELDIERIKEAIQQVEGEVNKVLNELGGVSREYADVRRSMLPGGARTVQMERELLRMIRLCRTANLSPDQLREYFNSGEMGDRILVLAAMKENPDLRDFELVIEAIENYSKPFDHDRFLVLASEMLSDLDRGQRDRLRDVINRQRDAGRIKSGMARWFTTERILKLMADQDDGEGLGVPKMG